MDRQTWKNNLLAAMYLESSKPVEEAGLAAKARALATCIRLAYHDRRIRTHQVYEQGKIACYMSLEYLIGKSLHTHLQALGPEEEATVRELVSELYGVDVCELFQFEPDAGLGNGGLGRLAACFMDAAATMGLPVRGYGLRYEKGMFAQKIEDGFQVEVGDNWLEEGDMWGLRHDDEMVPVHFKDFTLKAIPYDYIVPGYEVGNVNRLRLWRAEAMNDFDFQKFNNFDYIGAVSERALAENITRVLYPNDERREGQMLRFMQQYFFAQATLRDLFRQGNIKEMSSEERRCAISIQLNDTHPVIAIPEAIRILVDEMDFSFEEALSIAENVFNYTNHTILQEAMEKWPVSILEEVCPDTLQVIYRINDHYIEAMRARGMDETTIRGMAVVDKGILYMAHLGIHVAAKVNGVAELHTRILKERELAHFSELYPDKIINVTNGVTPRRFLMAANPLLSEALDTWIGKGWRKDLGELAKLKDFADDEAVMERFKEIKRTNKRRLAKRIKMVFDINVDPNSIFDIQIKRIHEYKRQLMYGFYIHHLYKEIKADPARRRTPRTCIFGGKAAPGYHRAKGIIKYINELARVINNDPEVGDRLKVVFIEDYDVSWAELLVSAADVSEQISTVGKEASGTGNMKFMMNGTVTLGTMDGANIEIFEEAGIENNYVFGTSMREMEESGYDPLVQYEKDPLVKEAVDSLTDGLLDDGGSFKFLDLRDALLDNKSGPNDEYYLLYDLKDYIATQNRIEQDFLDGDSWNKKSFWNMACASKFTADRSIMTYAKDIWHIEPKVIR
ncbi:MAG: glycogen/starch/alpha-glucan phosphorylase [Peptoniphilus sp.]|nr:glycogen/starch/alpha-glucan phosphorylase [Peptoniphilus sp.]MDY3118910.1 glycogen/starch/alpha-glucan phosphorylase [Peptoniphilus sp.]